jgi:hypothetical protein
MTQNIKKPKRRALYKYICSGCGKKRDSLIYNRATGEVCTICKRNQVPENQPSLFDVNNQKEIKNTKAKIIIENVVNGKKIIVKGGLGRDNFKVLVGSKGK